MKQREADFDQRLKDKEQELQDQMDFHVKKVGCALVTWLFVWVAVNELWVKFLSHAQKWRGSFAQESFIWNKIYISSARVVLKCLKTY